jgi:hypothetical protein
MSNAEDHSWDFLSGSEAESVDAMRAGLRDEVWARALLRDIPNTDELSRADKATLFELRFAYALHEAGIVPRYEVAGEGGSTLDFGFTNGGKEWRVELMRLEETEAARRATILEAIENGIRWISRILRTNADDRAQSEEGETLKAVQRICQKCERDELPHKFPVPWDAYQALLVDFRTFLNGGDEFDRIHVGLGGEFVPTDFHRRYWNGRLISGVFSPQTDVRGAASIRERAHFLGFVNEREFGPGKFGPATQFIANPNLFESADAAPEALATWPLQPARLLNGGR